MNEDFNNRCDQCEVHKYIACKNGFGGCPRSQISPLFSAEPENNSSEEFIGHVTKRVDGNLYNDMLQRISVVLRMIENIRELENENDMRQLLNLGARVIQAEKKLDGILVAENALKPKPPASVYDEFITAWRQTSKSHVGEMLNALLEAHSISEFETYFENPENMAALRGLSMS